MKKTKLLMSKTNPEGWKLEELLPIIIQEMKIKLEYLEEDESCSNEYRERILINANEIIKLLDKATILQVDLMKE